MSAGVVLSVKLAPASGSEPITFEWDEDQGEVDVRRDASLLLTCTLDDLTELRDALATFISHYETEDGE